MDIPWRWLYSTTVKSFSLLLLLAGVFIWMLTFTTESFGGIHSESRNVLRLYPPPEKHSSANEKKRQADVYDEWDWRRDAVKPKE